MDSTISSLFRHKPDTLTKLNHIQAQLNTIYTKLPEYTANSVFLPGCVVNTRNHAPNMDQINWRFCGGFLAGKREAIAAFCAEYLTTLTQSLRSTGRITWDVNWLAYLELEAKSWTPVWYRADHNDSIIEIVNGLPIPTYSLKELVTNEPSQHLVLKEYDFPIVDGYHPGSTSFVRWNDHAILNTRYINYSLANEGKSYVFVSGECLIRNKNFASWIDPDTAELVFTIQMNDMDLTDADGALLTRPRGDHIHYISYGLEDIRLFVGEHNTLQFIATTVDHSPTHWNRMMVGNYDVFNRKMTDCTVIAPPHPHGGCEKNWVPIFRPGIDVKPQFIYRWWPYEIGEIDAANQLRIHTSIELGDPIFKNTRGSSIFQPCTQLYQRDQSPKPGDFLVGLVHFSQTNASNAREYYHYLVALDQTTLLPVARSPAFYFFRKSIEFAIGFDLDTNKCRFWVSRMDTDPLMVEVEWRTFRFEELRSYEY
jgi:hypothetical protein